MSPIERIRKPIVLTQNNNITATSSGDENNATNLLNIFANNIVTHIDNNLYIRLPRPKFQGEFLKITLNPGGSHTLLICELATSSSDNLSINGVVVQEAGGTTHNTSNLSLDNNKEYFAYAYTKTNWQVSQKDPDEN